MLRAIAARVAPVEILRGGYHVGGYHERNRRVLDRADILVAFTGGRAGGTASVIRAAERRGIPVVRGRV